MKMSWSEELARLVRFMQKDLGSALVMTLLQDRGGHQKVRGAGPGGAHL